MRIDSHQHFWKYGSVDRGRIDDPMKILRRGLFPKQPPIEASAAGVDNAMAVQARQSLLETEWLLKLAVRHGFIKGAAGWVDLLSPHVSAELDRFSVGCGLKSGRDVVQNEPDRDFILRDDFDRRIREVEKRSMTYDILIFERHLPQTIRFVDNHPDYVFVLDHLAKSRIADALIEIWKKAIHQSAKRPDVFCKISGSVTEAGHANWSEGMLRPNFEATREAYGPIRLMYGSDWLVCLVACGCARRREVVAGWAARLSQDDQEWHFGRTAFEAYEL